MNKKLNMVEIMIDGMPSFIPKVAIDHIVPDEENKGFYKISTSSEHLKTIHKVEPSSYEDVKNAIIEVNESLKGLLESIAESLNEDSDKKCSEIHPGQKPVQKAKTE